MINGDDEQPHEDDEQFYRETVYNEDYYIEKEQEIIKQSNLDLELDRLENVAIREIREEELLKPTLVKPGVNKLEESDPDSESSSDDLADLPF